MSTVSLWRFGFAQGVQTLNGDIRYQYQYQDYTSNGSHMTVSTQSPMLNLAATGSLVNPAILSFDLRTFLSLNSSSGAAPLYSFNSKQFSWNYYTLGLSILKDLPLTTTISLSDGITQSSSSSSQFETEVRQLRRQSQSFRVMTHAISFLPSMNFAIDRSHQWSLNAESPIDQQATSYSMNLASGGHGGFVNVSGSLTENAERYSGSYTKSYALTVNGTRTLADQQVLNYDINYNRLGDITNLNGLASYTNSSSKELHYTTTLNSRYNATSTYQSRLSNLSQSIQYIQNENLRYGLSLGGAVGRTEYPIARTDEDNSSLSSGLSVQHTRSFSGFGLSNSLSMGYGLSNYRDRQQTLSAGFANSLRTHVGTFDISTGQTFAYGQVKDNVKQNSVSNGVNLNVEGIAWYDFRSQLIVEYQSDNYSGDLQGFGNQQQIHLQWSLGSPQMYFVIPFTVAASGGETWYLRGVIGRAFTWEGSFISRQFFVRDLSFMYRHSRVYDAGFNRESVTHSIEMQYQLRAIAINVRYQNYQLLNTQNMFWLTVTRPF
jgi:hypothetical protein